MKEKSHRQSAKTAISNITKHASNKYLKTGPFAG